MNHELTEKILEFLRNNVDHEAIIDKGAEWAVIYVTGDDGFNYEVTIEKGEEDND